jgi:HEPN domain-containing protein
MDEAKQQLVRAWLLKARNDLETARQIGGFPGGHLDAAIYHCQQVVEKAVKGFLALHDHRLERTHDLERLVTLAAGYEPGFAAWADAAIVLTPYAADYRYPGEAAASEPSRPEFDEAVRLAAALAGYVFALAPIHCQPCQGKGNDIAPDR